MNKLKWYLLLAAITGISAAYASKRPHASRTTLHHFSFRFKSTDGSQTYYGKDLTEIGYVKGLDYDCIPPVSTCAFLADPELEHFDMTGSWFYTSDIPVSGYDNTGVFDDLD
jgi:hypothetical protein